MSCPSLFIPTSSLSYSHGNTTTNVSTSPSTPTLTKSIFSCANPTNIEDARLLDPSYLSSVPIPLHNFSHGLCAGGSSRFGGAQYSHAIPYVDPQGTLHDSDYRPFPIIRQNKRPSLSPFATRKPWWETGDGDGFESDHTDTDEDTPFIHYFFKRYPLKRSGSHDNCPVTTDHHTDKCVGRGKRGKGPPLLKLNTSSAGLGAGSSAGYHTHASTIPARAAACHNAPLIPQYATMLSSSPPAVENVSHHGREKEKKIWSSLRWKSSNRKEGAE